MFNKLLLGSIPKFCGFDDCILKFPKSVRSPSRSLLLLEDCGCAGEVPINVLPGGGDKLSGTLDCDNPESKLGTVDDTFGGGMIFGKIFGALSIKLDN